jgi:hypothetical protein
MKLLSPLIAALVYAQAISVWSGEASLGNKDKEPGTQYVLLLSKDGQEKLGLTNSVLQGTYSKSFHVLTDDEIRMVRSLVGDERIARGFQSEVRLHGVTNQVKRSLILAALVNYDVFDETIFADKEGESLYKFNGSDLSPFKRKGEQRPTIGIIGIRGPTNNFVVVLSEGDCRKVGRSSVSNLVRGTYALATRTLTEEEIRHAREVLKDAEIARGHISSLKLTGVGSQVERQIVVGVLSEYTVGQYPKLNTREEMILMDKETNYKFRMKSADPSQLKPETVEKYPWPW